MLHNQLKLGLLYFLLPISLLSQEAEEKVYKNEVDIDLIDLIDGTLQISYERSLNGNFSVNLGVGYKTEEGLVRLSGIDTKKLTTNDITYSGFKFIPEVRYYLNKTQSKELDGFYFGAYFKHSSYQSDLKGEYTDNDDVMYDILFDAKLKVSSVGFMVGYKLPIGKRFSLDFLIAGPGAGWHNYTLKNKKDLPDEFYDDLNEALDNYFQSLNIDFNFSKVDEKLDFILPSFRYGISLGYKF